MGDHKIGYLLPIIGTFLMFCVTAFFNALAGNELGRDWGIYVNTTGGVSDAYDTEITPSGWTFSIWGLIYLWQILWIVYSLSLTCRRGVGGYLYYSPPIIPWYLHIIYMINLGLNISWLILWDRQEMVAALVVIMLMVATTHACSIISYRALSREGPELVHNGLKYDPGMVIAFVHNGLAMYSTWLSIATLLNMAIVMTYVGNVGMEDAATVAISILLVELVAWFLADNIFLDSHTRWTVTPYFVVVFALFGVLDNNYVAGRRNSTFTAVLQGLAVLCLLCKLVIATVRQCRNPLWSDKYGGNAGLKA